MERRQSFSHLLRGPRPAVTKQDRWISDSVGIRAFGGRRSYAVPPTRTQPAIALQKAVTAGRDWPFWSWSNSLRGTSRNSFDVAACRAWGQTCKGTSTYPGVDYLNIDSRLSGDALLVRQTARKYVDEQVMPIIADSDDEGRFPSHFGRQTEHKSGIVHSLA